MISKDTVTCPACRYSGWGHRFSDEAYLEGSHDGTCPKCMSLVRFITEVTLIYRQDDTQ